MAKIFRGSSVDFLYSQLRTLFERVSVAKPSASRNSSMEAFVVCEGFKGGPYVNLPLQGFDVLGVESSHDNHRTDEGDLTESDINIPFIACGDLSNWDNERMVLDADKSYPITSEQRYIPPVAPPIQPPYATAQKLSKFDFKTAEGNEMNLPEGPTKSER